MERERKDNNPVVQKSRSEERNKAIRRLRLSLRVGRMPSLRHVWERASVSPRTAGRYVVAVVVAGILLPPLFFHAFPTDYA